MKEEEAFYSRIDRANCISVILTQIGNRFFFFSSGAGVKFQTVCLTKKKGHLRDGTHVYGSYFLPALLQEYEILAPSL